MSDTDTRTEIRFDTGRIAKVTKTPSGGVRVEAVIARATILEYDRAVGPSRELVSREELGRHDSISSLRDAPLTLGHPTTNGVRRMVTPATFKHDAIGHVSGTPRLDGDLLVAEIAVNDAATIAALERRELTELSAGYEVALDPKPGVHRGAHYDAVQRGRRYNHVALLPPGGARAGAECTVRMDGRDDVVVPMPRPTFDAYVCSSCRRDLRDERSDGLGFHDPADGDFDRSLRGELPPGVELRTDNRDPQPTTPFVAPPDISQKWRR